MPKSPMPILLAIGLFVAPIALTGCGDPAPPVTNPSAPSPASPSPGGNPPTTGRPVALNNR